MELVSIIVPVYNAETYIINCVNGIINQSYTNIEVILVNDGSTDESGKLCDLLEKKDTRIKVLHSSNKGVSNARNLGLHIAIGNYILFVDSDDFIEPDLVQVYTDTMLKWDVDMVISSFYEYYNKNGRLEKYKMQYSGIASSGQIKEKVLAESFFGKNNNKLDSSCWGKLFKRSIIKNRQIVFDTTLKYGEDTLFVFDYMLAIENVYFLKDFFPYHYNIHEQSVTQKFEKNRYWRWKYLISKYQEKLGSEYLEHYNRIYFLIALDSYYPLSKISVAQNKSLLKSELKLMLSDNDLIKSFQYKDYTILDLREKFFLFLIKNKYVNFLLLFLMGKNILNYLQRKVANDSFRIEF